MISCVDPSETYDAGLVRLVDAGGALNVQARYQHVADIGQFHFRGRRTHRGDDVPTVAGEVLRRGLAEAGSRASYESGLSHWVIPYPRNDWSG